MASAILILYIAVQDMSKNSDIMRQIQKISDTFKHCINDHSMSETNNCSFPNTSASFINSSNMSLDALGLNPVIEVPWLAGATHHPRTSVLKFAMVKELEQFLIFSVLSQMCNRMVTILRCSCTMCKRTMSLHSAGI